MTAIIDKFYRLEKLGAIASADDWLLMREARNSFSHDYPDDQELQAASLNKVLNWQHNYLKCSMELRHLLGLTCRLKNLCIEFYIRKNNAQIFYQMHVRDLALTSAPDNDILNMFFLLQCCNF